MNCLKSAYPLGFVFVLAVFPGCTSPVDSEREWERQVGVIEFGGTQEPPIELPDTVEQGVPFASTVVTFGSSTCV